MSLRLWLILALISFLSGLAALAQNQPTSTVRTLLATGRVASVVNTPLAFRLLSVGLPPTQQASYAGPNAMVYSASGGLRLERGGNSQALGEGGGAFIPEGLVTTFSNATQELTNFLLFILSPIADVQKPLLGSPVNVDELYRSPEPLPGLQSGPYEYSLTRVSLPPAMPANPPHSRSGAALYYIGGGNGLFTAEGKTEPRPAGMAHFEPRGLVHQWANPGDVPLILIQANISPEGIPAVLAAGGQ